MSAKQNSNEPNTAFDVMLQKSGITRGSIYLMIMMLSGGGIIEKNHSDSVSTTTAQIAALDTSLQLAKQEQGFMKEKLDQLDRDVLQLSRIVDRSIGASNANRPTGISRTQLSPVASLP